MVKEIPLWKSLKVQDLPGFNEASPPLPLNVCGSLPHTTLTNPTPAGLPRSSKGKPPEQSQTKLWRQKKVLSLLIIEHAFQELVLHRGLALGGYRNKFRGENKRAKNSATRDKC